MHTWFLTKVKYEAIGEEGNVKKTIKVNLVDALSFTEVEARIIEEMKPFISGEFKVDAIKREKINEIFYNENGDRWYKAKVSFITLDEEKGVEKKTATTMMVEANDIEEARKGLEEGMKGTMADYTIDKIEETKIENIFKYEKEN